MGSKHSSMYQPPRAAVTKYPKLSDLKQYTSIFFLQALSVNKRSRINYFFEDYRNKSFHSSWFGWLWVSSGLPCFSLFLCHHKPFSLHPGLSSCGRPTIGCRPLLARYALTQINGLHLQRPCFQAGPHSECLRGEGAEGRRRKSLLTVTLGTLLTFFLRVLVTGQKGADSCLS